MEHLNRASQKAPASIDGVIAKITAVTEKSRAVLSEEDLALLDNCLSELQELKDNPPPPDICIEDVGRIVLLLLKFIFNDFQID